VHVPINTAFFRYFLTLSLCIPHRIPRSIRRLARRLKYAGLFEEDFFPGATMADVTFDLSQRILQAARLAAAIHLQQVAAERSGSGLLNGQQVVIGGAGPSASGNRVASVTQTSKDGRLPGLCARWPEGEAE